MFCTRICAMQFWPLLKFAFPVRLLVLHLRNHLLLIGLWITMSLLLSGRLGSFLGIHYLLLTPEYLGKVDFWSFALVGIAAGWYFMTWHLTTYLLVAHRFPFLATLRAPFTQFCINNSFIPLIFFLFYIGQSAWFQWHYELTDGKEIVLNLLGLVTGFALLVFVLSGYFFLTNKDIYAFLHIGKIVPREGGHLFAPGQRVPTLLDIQEGSTAFRCDFYLSARGRWRPVRNVSHYNKAILARVFRQNHANAVVVQITSMLFLMLLGLFMEQAWARIPTGATIFILASLVFAAFGALIYWFRHWATLSFLVLVAGLNYLTGLEVFNYRSRAIGLNYEKSLQKPYNYTSLKSHCTDSIVQADKANTQAILQRWAEKNTKEPSKKPKLVVLCFSGGGLRSAQWSMQTLMQVNSATKGKLFDRTALMTGASGGMYAATWFRNLHLQLGSQQVSNLAADKRYLLKSSEDLLNPISFAIISNDLFFPLTRVRVGEYLYRRDRGYMLEKSLLENSDGVLAGTLGSYADAERSAQVPMLVYTPFILNDGRKLLIGTQGLSYLMLPPSGRQLSDKLEIDAVDFRRLFESNSADSLRVTSALRMNSTYPLILPNVWLPTKPSIEIMDAGLRDNYGTSTAARFLHTFSGWIKEHTSGVVVVQVRCWEKQQPISESDQKGVVEEVLGKATVAAMITRMEDYRQDNDLAMLSSILGTDKLDIVRFVYHPIKKESEASLSFHLSMRERLDILNAYYRPENLAEVERLRRLLE